MMRGEPDLPPYPTADRHKEVAMRSGRKPQGVKLLDELQADAEAKRTMKVFLRTVSGECTVAEACHQLGVNPSWFFERRKRWLQESLDLLGPRPMGRPPNVAAPSEAHVAHLEDKVQKLTAELTAANLRTALAGSARRECALQDDRKKGAPIRRRRKRRGRPK